MSETNSPDLKRLHPLIQSAVRAIPVSDRYVVALSGGLDSMALLIFALPYLLKSYKPTIQIIHVHHGLSQFADEWAEHCLSVSRAMDLACHVERVTVVTKGKGLEAAAREARYAVFERYLSGGGVLLQGHHQNDQAETVLMRLLRGAGPEGLSGIPQQRVLSNGQLFRPWLAVSRGVLETEIQKYPVKWVEDESNTDLQFDRNFLRHNILPLLEARWPSVLTSISRTAARSDQAHQQLVLWCEAEIVGVKSKQYAVEQALDLNALAQYSNEQQWFLLRHWLDCLKVEHPSEKVFERIWSEMIPAASDALPALRWGGNHLRRFNGCLFYLSDQAVDARAYEYQVFGGEKVFGNDHAPISNFSIGGRELSVICQPAPHSVQNKLLIRAPRQNESVMVRSRCGGESMVLSGSTQHKSLKKLLQVKKVAPWRRLHLPLIYYDDVLALVILGPNESLIADGFQADVGGVVVELSWE
ncbi:MAG: tRNA(Ile)-lysidine synthase [Pseudohongiellaceae bacterium]|jgi:tRNA(Ile)-lysidine synthase